MRSYPDPRLWAVAALVLAMASTASPPAMAQSEAACDRIAREQADASGGGRRAYGRAFDDCMRRGADGGGRERARPAGLREPGSPEWYDYCANRYRSFNPDTGFYRGYDGRYHLCR